MPAIATYTAGSARSAVDPCPDLNEGRGPCAEPEHFALVAHELSLRGTDGQKPILDGCSLALGVGERVRIVGPNGSGRSSLIEVLAGRRPPNAGVLVSNEPVEVRPGVFASGGVSAPPIGERGLLFSGSLLWNLTMATGRPATVEDRVRAEAVLVDLGMGDLLRRMPAGLDQWVGEGGWRFSDGELARIQVARALLQRASLILLDDPFASLDPLTREACMLAIERSSASVVLAEPA
jgi:ATP-binding cassette subfamily B protein